MEKRQLCLCCIKDLSVITYKWTTKQYWNFMHEVITSINSLCKWDSRLSFLGMNLIIKLPSSFKNKRGWKFSDLINLRINHSIRGCTWSSSLQNSWNNKMVRADIYSILAVSLCNIIWSNRAHTLYKNIWHLFMLIHLLLYW